MYIKQIALSIFILFGVSVIFLYYPLLNFSQIENQLIRWDNEGKEVLTTMRPISQYTKDLNHEKYYSENYSQTKYILTTFDPYNPQISFLAERKNSTSGEKAEIVLDIFELKRNGLFTYDL